ncbi:ion transporter [Thiobacter aerophilum]|uniref:Ion transporter n=1 Tax=Thiobacter aerophilum TaxID=3121275 RepID=A0ABV0EIH1_9BURK
MKLRQLAGMGGVPPHDNPRAYLWERRLRWVMVSIALLALPSYYLETAHATGPWHWLGRGLDALILFAFSAEFLWLLHLTRQKRLYVLHNWLDLLIIGGAFVSLWEVSLEWLPVVRLARLVYVTLIFARVLAVMRTLLAPASVPYLLGWGVLLFGLAGAGFYWLDPGVSSFWEGVWLAFVTGSTVGYGDIVPSTVGSRILAMLVVLVGFAMLSLVTAAFAAFFIGEDEKRLRREMHQDIRELRAEVRDLKAELERLAALLESLSRPSRP